MKWTLSAFLLLAGAGDDKEAERILTAFREKIEKARTLQAEIKVTTHFGGLAMGSAAGALKIKGDDRWSLDFTYEDRGEEEESARKVSVKAVCDGTRVVIRGGRPGSQMKPAETTALLRHALMTTSLFTMALTREPFGEARDFLRPPLAGTIRDLGAETRGGKACRAIEYAILVQGETATAKLVLDPATFRPLDREVRMDQMVMTETFTAFAVDAEVADSEFIYASKRRLARAQAEQLARSVELYALYTGRSPQCLEDLLKPPAAPDPDVFWPEGGFLLGAAMPRDPWGRPFGLRTEKGRIAVTCLGADGKAGGSGEDEDAVVLAPPNPRRPVGAPTERLRKHYQSRLMLHLLAAAVRAYRETYGDLPGRKAALWDRPVGAAVWPEGGWIPGGRMPADGWGEEFRLITDRGVARVQVQDPKVRLVSFKQLTPEERAKLEAASRLRLSDDERGQLMRLFDRLGDDDLETREEAQTELAQWGAGAEGLLEERLKVEKDRESRARLDLALRSLPRRPPPWTSELALLSHTVTGEDGGGDASANHRNASACLKVITSAEADFRANDRDGNRVNDFWTGDLSGLYTLKDPAGNMIKLIELSLAAADAAPLEAGAAGGKYVAIATLVDPAPKAGYLFRAMLKDKTVEEPQAYAQDSDGAPKMGKVHNTSRFGFCAYPADYPVTGLRTFIINENNTMFYKDTEGEPVLEWPTDQELRDWRKLD